MHFVLGYCVTDCLGIAVKLFKEWNMIHFLLITRCTFKVYFNRLTPSLVWLLRQEFMSSMKCWQLLYSIHGNSPLSVIKTVNISEIPENTEKKRFSVLLNKILSDSLQKIAFLNFCWVDRKLIYNKFWYNLLISIDIFLI